MSTFFYFGYGSNMLTTRLAARCPSARVTTVAEARGFNFAFGKHSQDGSSKVTLVSTGENEDVVLGTVFEIDRSELPALDAAEGKGNGYNRHDDFCVTRRGANDLISTVTYVAHKVESGRRPYDWYLALVLAGIAEHSLGDEYAARLRTVVFDVDKVTRRWTRLEALRALEQAGVHDYTSLLTKPNSA